LTFKQKNAILSVNIVTSLGVANPDGENIEEFLEEDGEDFGVDAGLFEALRNKPWGKHHVPFPWSFAFPVEYLAYVGDKIVT